MKNLDLNGLGVQEMNATEMANIDGGEDKILVIKGMFDGVKGNTEVLLLGKKL